VEECEPAKRRQGRRVSDGLAPASGERDHVCVQDQCWIGVRARDRCMRVRRISVRSRDQCEGAGSACSGIREMVVEEKVEQEESV
jgi:hypothetical protein